MNEQLRNGLNTLSSTAMREATMLIGNLLNTSVTIAEPNVSLLMANDVSMMISGTGDTRNAFCQAYIGGGIAGEALLTLESTSPELIARLLNYEGDMDAITSEELLADTANLIIGACLRGLGNQIDVQFCQTHPRTLGENLAAGRKITGPRASYEMLSFDTTGKVEDSTTTFSLLMLFTPSSIQTFSRLVNYLQ